MFVSKGSKHLGRLPISDAPFKTTLKKRSLRSLTLKGSFAVTNWGDVRKFFKLFKPRLLRVNSTYICQRKAINSKKQYRQGV